MTPSGLRSFLRRVAEATRLRDGEESQDRSAWRDRLRRRQRRAAHRRDAPCTDGHSHRKKSTVRDHTRAMTRSERDHVIKATLLAASEPGLNPRTQRKRRATADLIAFLAGTGRIEEARRVRWHDVHLELAAMRRRQELPVGGAQCRRRGSRVTLIVVRASSARRRGCGTRWLVVVRGPTAHRVACADAQATGTCRPWPSPPSNRHCSGPTDTP
jgi:hypothetical protein